MRLIRNNAVQKVGSIIRLIKKNEGCIVRHIEVRNAMRIIGEGMA